MKKCLSCIVLIALLFSKPLQSQKRSITSQDFYQIKEITECTISPDGRTIAYTVQRVDRKNNKYISNIWMISTDGKDRRQLTTSLFRDTSPAWSPDSKYLAFASNRSGKSQIWIIPVDGGEAWSLTNIETGASAPAWSPDGSKITFLSRVAEPADSIKTVNSNIIVKNGKEYARDVKVIRNLKYRYGTSYFDDRYTHIFEIDINGEKARQLTFGKYHDSQPVWSPNGKFIAFSSNRNGNFTMDDNTDLFLIPSDGGKLRKLTDNPGPDRNPVWSPDSKMICYLARPRANDYAVHNELRLLNLRTKSSSILTASFDKSPFSHHWSSDGKRIYFLAAEHGNIHLFALLTKNAAIHKIINGTRQIESYSMFNNKRIAFITSENTNPSDLFICNEKGNREQRLTHINQTLLDDLKLTKPEDFYFESTDGQKIHGWILKPPEFDEDRNYPLILEIHGGPRWYFGNTWFQEFHLLAAEGYVVFYCNPRLSASYGQDFTLAGRGEWGTLDYQDLMAGVDYVIGKGYIDTTKMGITGGSYGGFMTNWIISKTNRFAAAVTQRSLSNLVSFYGTTDIQSFSEYEFGLPWENWERYYKHSPITYAHNIQTPVLIIHAENDFRVPISQAEELFAILKRNDVEVEFVRYPDEGHDLSRSGQPIHRVDRYNRILDWFNKHLSR
ncbi:prolyl oligopeptidase family serine peptidase [candidate division KSB1 bacterium]|nr:prolyl oligopeptidase family serine peptidase [candidate division KSB1 bacterium]